MEAALALALAAGLFDASELREAQSALPSENECHRCVAYCVSVDEQAGKRARRGEMWAWDEIRAARKAGKFFHHAALVQNPYYCVLGDHLRNLRFLEATWPEWRTRVPMIP